MQWLIELTEDCKAVKSELEVRRMKKSITYLCQRGNINALKFFLPNILYKYYKTEKRMNVPFNWFRFLNKKA